MVERIIGSMFGLIILFLVLSRASEFNSIIKAAGSFVTQQTAQLQGYGTVTAPAAKVAQGTGGTGSSNPFGNVSFPGSLFGTA